MNSVNTLGGPLNVDDLGVTMMHEHIFVLNPEVELLWPGWADWNRARDTDRAVAAMRRLKERGVRTILDPTVGGLGRHLPAMRDVAAQAEINVIACTGWYTKATLPYSFSRHTGDALADLLAGLFLRDIEQGLEGTDVKAGCLKCCVDKPGLTPDVEAVLRGVARAHVQSNAPITTHTDAETRRGLDQQRVFREEGVDLTRVVIGHSNQSDDLEYLERVLAEGSYVGFDRCGLESPRAPLDLQLENLAELIQRGYVQQIVLSHDNSVYLDLYPVKQFAARYEPGLFPYAYVHERVLPGLRERGVTDDDLHAMLVDNPRRFFSSKPGREEGAQS